jgi:hypothetical protein
LRDLLTNKCVFISKESSCRKPCWVKTIGNIMWLKVMVIAIKTAEHCTKTDMKTSRTEQKTQVWIHETMPAWFFTKASKTCDRGKTASLTNVVGKTGYLHAEN